MATSRQTEFKLAIPTATASSAAAVPDEKEQAVLAALQEAYKATGKHFLTMYENSLSPQQKAAEITRKLFERLHKEVDDVVTFKSLQSFGILLSAPVLNQIPSEQHKFYRSFLLAMYNLVKIYRAIQMNNIVNDLYKEKCEKLIAAFQGGKEQEITSQFLLLNKKPLIKQKPRRQISPTKKYKKLRLFNATPTRRISETEETEAAELLQEAKQEAVSVQAPLHPYQPIKVVAPVSSPSSPSRLSSYLFFAGLCVLFLGGILTAALGVGIPLIVCGVVGFALCFSGGAGKCVGGSLCPTTLPVEKNASPVKNYAIPAAMIATSHPAPASDEASTPVASTTAAAPSPVSQPVLACDQQSHRM